MQSSLNQRLADLAGEAEELAATSLCGQEPGFRRLLDGLRQAQGIALKIPACGCKPKARASIDDISAYCIELGLTALDGGWFWDKCEGCGWINGRLKIKDWKATVRAWKAIGVFPSQKQGHKNGIVNGQVSQTAPIDRMIAMKEFERVEQKIANIRLGYSGMQDWRKEDIAEIRKLKERRDVLKKQLGVEV